MNYSTETKQSSKRERDEGTSILRGKTKLQRPPRKGSDRAHIIDYSTFKSISSSLPGRPVTSEKTKHDISHTLNSADNLRYKTPKGNRGYGRHQDNGDDKAILQKYHSGSHLNATEAHRAKQKVKSYHKIKGRNASVDRVCVEIGNMTIHDGKKGRPRLVKNEVVSRKSDVDRRSSSVRSGAVRIREDGGVDQRSSAVRSGAVRIRKDGRVDGRSKSVRNGNLKTHSSGATSSGSRKTTSKNTSSRNIRSRNTSYNSRRSTSSRTIHTGSRGGRYYVNSNGNKTYV
eukprot:TRINITY_DN553_c0_g1_i1.p1 TRINITY_DN553_c0_g1~~TRINITY_DN553_c0_g1_i1.p1  ORF type:complete len:286 (+),score=47.30 TRINITY_DN553_c0_g1_i1:29-886(+)